MKGIRLIIEEKENKISINIEQHLKKRSGKYGWIPTKSIIIKKSLSNKTIGKEIIDVRPFNVQISEEYLKELESNEI